MVTYNLLLVVLYRPISIHTTTQVVTRVGSANTYLAEISIHTTTQVVTKIAVPFILGIIYFNPHHHAGGDYAIQQSSAAGRDFNPHHHAGGDVQEGLLYVGPFKISIHTTTQVVTRCGC